MIDQLFGSKTRVKLLQLFMSNPNRSYYVREITRKIDEQINSVRRELANLLSIGIISSDTTDNRLYYEVNQKYVYYEPLSIMFGGRLKNVKQIKPKGSDDSEIVNEEKPSDDPYIEKFRRAGNMSLLLLTGQFTRDAKCGVDMLIVGDMNDSAVEKAVEGIEAIENKELKYAVFTIEEFKYRRQIHDRFLSDLLSAKKQVILDTENLIEDKEKEN